MGEIRLFEARLCQHRRIDVNATFAIWRVGFTLISLVGSLVEGLGNQLSDIDVLVLGPRHALDQEGVYFRDSFYEGNLQRLPGGQEVNVTYLTEAVLDEFSRRIDTTTRMVTNPVEAGSAGRPERLGAEELRLLHWIRVGKPLVRSERVAEWRDRLRSEHLPDYLVMWNLNMHFSHREDAIEQAARGDRLSALAMLRQAAETLVGALLAASGGIQHLSQVATATPRATR